MDIHKNNAMAITRWVLIIVSIAIFLVSLLIYFSPNNRLKRAVNTIIGTEVVFPDALDYYVDGVEITNDELVLAVDEVIKNNDCYKVLLYVNPDECLSCSLNLAKWKVLIKEAKLQFGNRLKFVFLFETSDRQALLDHIGSQTFTYGIFIDRNSEMIGLNTYLKHCPTHSFLLDPTNKVVAIGNPTHEHAVWEVYKQCVEGNVHVSH